jgi:hypothetical protein
MRRYTSRRHVGRHRSPSRPRAARHAGSGLLGLVCALVAVFVSPAAPALAGTGWITICPPTHTASDDPIVYPGQPGASHLHQFFGNRSTNASSTYSSMLAASTSCGTGTDRAGYWVPALYEDGRYVSPTGYRADGKPTRTVFYYRADNLSSSYRAAHPVEAFPPNFRLIAGNSHAMSPAEQPKLGKEIYWGCSDNSTNKLQLPPSCSSGAISLHVGFPNCWNGQVTGTNDTPNVVYPSSGVCPSTYPRVLPRVIFRMEYPVGTTTGNITLASGPSYTIHADFWNTWQQTDLERLVSSCLRTNTDCGNNPQ